MTANPIGQFRSNIESKDSPLVDRRRRSRMRVRWALRFPKWDTAEAVEAVTHNLSSDGFGFLAKIPFVPGEFRVCMLAVPANHPRTDEPAMSVECKVRIVRSQAQQDGLYEIGCKIEDYRFTNSPDRLPQPTLHKLTSQTPV